MQTKNRAQSISSTSVRLIRKQKLLMELEVHTVIKPEVEVMVVMAPEDRDLRCQFINYPQGTFASVAINKVITLRIARRIRMRHLTLTTERVCQRSICGREIWVSVRRNFLRTSRRTSERSSKRFKSFNRVNCCRVFSRIMMCFKTCMIRWTKLLILKRIQLINSICLLLFNAIYAKV